MKRNPSPTTAEAVPGPFEREVIASFMKRHVAVDGDDPPNSDPELGPGAEIDDLPFADTGFRHGLRGLARHAAPKVRHAPMVIATALLFARALDAQPGLVSDLRHGTPCLVVDVPDALALTILRGLWPTLLYGANSVTERIDRSTPQDLVRTDALSLVVTDRPKEKDKEEQDRNFLQALQLALPILCLSPDAATALAPSVVRAADHHIALPGLDASILATTIRIVTGKRCRKADIAGLASGVDVTLADVAISIRMGRSPAECVTRLRRLAEAQEFRTGVGRDLSLAQLHGLGPAVEWARSTLSDLEAWRAGAPWSQVSSGALLVGPPGCGKTLLAAVLAAEGRMPLVTGSLAQWQAEDQAHLGTTLRAMRRAFDDAKMKAIGGGKTGRRGSVLLIDECDSFPDRSKVKHDHRDYVVEVVNALLEQLDGAVGREGVIVIGTTNDMGRCDPAMLRPRRLSKVIMVGFPTLEERVSMLRVRLGPDLADAELTSVARLTERATGADIEELVSDARRIARQAARPLAISDLLSVAGKADADLPVALAFRTAVHEAGHAVVTAMEIGTAGLVVALQSRGGNAGWVERIGADRSAGTRAEIETVIRIQLAGRAAEETLLGSPSAGARQDLADATTLAANIVGAWGLGGGLRLLSIATAGTADLLANPGVRHEATEILDTLYGQTLARIHEHQDAVLRIANRLMSERRLDGTAVAALIGPPLSPTEQGGGTPMLSPALADAASGHGGAA